MNLLADLMQFACDPRHAGTIIACLVSAAFLKLAVTELSR